jgi:hypothetical protein
MRLKMPFVVLKRQQTKSIGEQADVREKDPKKDENENDIENEEITEKRKRKETRPLSPPHKRTKITPNASDICGYTAVGVVKWKYVFKTRPKPLTVLNSSNDTKVNFIK